MAYPSFYGTAAYPTFQSRAVPYPILDGVLVCRSQKRIAILAEVQPRDNRRPHRFARQLAGHGRILESQAADNQVLGSLQNNFRVQR